MELGNFSVSLTVKDLEASRQFYEKFGFQSVGPQEKDRLLRKYWTIPERQIETSVVLADPKWWESQRR